MWGTLTDISLHGCYVEMNATSPIDTKVDLVLKSFGIRIEVSGTVRTSYPFLGMGIGFDRNRTSATAATEATPQHTDRAQRRLQWNSARENGMKDYIIRPTRERLAR